jgi:hypothetical protein
MRLCTITVWIRHMLESIRNIRLKVKPGQESRFVPVFQQGIFIKTRAGLPLDEVLEEAGFPRKYLEERVQTVFLDGSAVDDLDRAIVESGSVIALSGAMPGLAGAIFRKGSPISALRSSTAREMGAPRSEDTMYEIRLKLFNTIANEMGPALLRDGILVKGPDLEEFLSNRRKLAEDAVLEAELDGVPISPAELFGGKSISLTYVVLQIISPDPSA